MCKNVLMKNSNISCRDDTNYLVEIMCSDHDRFDLTSDEDFAKVTDMLARSLARNLGCPRRHSKVSKKLRV